MAVRAETSAREGGTPAERPSAGRWYVLVVLGLVYTFNFVDRQMMGILLEPIRKDLALQDWQLGVIMGFGFALMYSTLGLPIAALCERTNRVKVVAAAITFWSAMTMLCGAAQSSLGLLLARIGVGLGEAGGSPPSQSLMSDVFPPQERARALSIWALGSPIGTAMGVVGGAWIAETYGWRTAFMAAGAPGILIGLLMILTVRDPRPTAERPPATSFGQMTASIANVLRQPALLLASLGAGVATMVSYCAVLWGPTYFIRQFELSPVTVSWFAAIVLGVAAAVGTAGGGFLVHHFGRRSVKAQVLVPAIGFALAAPTYWLALAVDDALLAAAIVLIPTILFAFWSGPVFALFQNLAPPGERAMSTAVLFMVVNLVGLGLGPTAVGMLSSRFQAEYGLAGGLHRALVILVGALLPAALLMFAAARALGRQAGAEAIQHRAHAQEGV